MITQAIVKQLLDYNKSTGELLWRERDSSWFASSREWKRWNTRYAGKPAFTYVNKGFRWGCILGQNYLAHRIAWLWVTGKITPAIRFKNDDPTDLRFDNLAQHTSTAAVREWRREHKRRTLPERTRLLNVAA